MVTTQESVNNQSIQSSFFVADWKVEPDTLRIFGADSEVRLEPKVMQVLVYMAGKPAKVISREELEANVWVGRVVGYDAVASTIIKLRKAFGDDSRDPQIIETIPKKGYRLIATVEQQPFPKLTRLSEGETKGPESGKPAVHYPARQKLLIVAVLLLFAGLVLWLMQTSEKPPSIPERSHVSTRPEQPSIAVLPFLNVGANPDHEYFSDGITEDLITDLSKVRGLSVLARNSAFAYKDSSKDEQIVGRELGVDYVLEGSVQRTKNRLRINVQLIGVDDGRNLWAERYDRELGEIFQIQDELAGNIVSAMEVELAPDDRRRLSRDYVASVEAYDEFLKGLAYQTRRSPDDSTLARDHFGRAIELDPGFARAYAALALAYARDAIDGWEPSVHDSLDQASELVERALQLDTSIPQLYFVMGQVKLFEKDYSAAIKAAEKAIVLKPSYADGYALLGWVLHFAGRSEEALNVMQRALRLNPRVPATYRLVLGAIHYALEDLEQAIELLRTGAEISPNYQQLRIWLTAAYAAAGHMEEAKWEVVEIHRITPSFSLKSVEEGFPFRDPMYLDRFLADLRKAGLSD